MAVELGYVVKITHVLGGTETVSTVLMRTADDPLEAADELARTFRGDDCELDESSGLYIYGGSDVGVKPAPPATPVSETVFATLREHLTCSTINLG